MAKADSNSRKITNAGKIPRQKLPRRRLVYRDDYIVGLCRGRRVLHIGCTDAPLTQAKFEAGALLHRKLEGVAAHLVGVDLDSESIEWLRERGIENIHVADAERIREFLEGINFVPDLILAGEVLEHLANPGAFLSGIEEGMREGAELVLSVPNAFWGEGFLHVLTGREKVHPEHVAYYSYHTVRRLLERIGLAVVDIFPYRNPAAGLGKKITEMLQRPLQWISPHFCAGYVVIGRIAD